MITWQQGNLWLRDQWQRLASRGLHRVEIAAIFLVIVAVIIGSGLIGRGYSLSEGQISPFDIKAPRTMSYVDEAATESARREAASRVENVYQRDDQVLPDVESNLQDIFNEIRDLQRQNLPAQRSYSLLQNYLIQVTGASDQDIGSLDPTSLSVLLSLDNNQLTRLYTLCQGWLQDSLENGLTEDALPNARDNLSDQVASSNLSRNLKPAVTFILTHILRPNLLLDLATYASKVAEAQASVSPVRHSVQANQVIVAKGEVIDSDHLSELQQLGLLRTQNIWPPLFGVIFLTLLVGGLIVGYLKQFQPRFYEQKQYLTLYGILFTLTLLAAKGVTMISLGSQVETAGLIGYLAPLAGGAMLITVLMDARLAVFTSFILSLLLGVMMNGQISFVVAGLAGSLAGVYSVSNLSDRAGLIRGGIFVSAVNAAVIFVLGLLYASNAVVVSDWNGTGSGGRFPVFDHDAGVSTVPGDLVRDHRLRQSAGTGQP